MLAKTELGCMYMTAKEQAKDMVHVQYESFNLMQQLRGHIITLEMYIRIHCHRHNILCKAQVFCVEVWLDQSHSLIS